MTQQTLGWMLFVAGIAMILSLLAGDIAALSKWSDALYPSFIGGVIGHVGAVLTAFAGGKLLPAPPVTGAVSDQKRADLAKV